MKILRNVLLAAVPICVTVLALVAAEPVNFVLPTDPTTPAIRASFSGGLSGKVTEYVLLGSGELVKTVGGGGLETRVQSVDIAFADAEELMRTAIEGDLLVEEPVSLLSRYLEAERLEHEASWRPGIRPPVVGVAPADSSQALLEIRVDSFDDKGPRATAFGIQGLHFRQERQPQIAELTAWVRIVEAMEILLRERSGGAE